MAHQHIHGTTQDQPAVRLAKEWLELLPLPIRQQSATTAPSLRPGRALPHESLQHTLSVYDQLLEGQA